MENLVNLTDHSVVALPSMDRDGEELLLVVLSGSFVLPEPGASPDLDLEVCECQEPVAMVDEFWGVPGQSSLKTVGQSAYRKPATDVHLRGHAWAPGGRATTQSVVGLDIDGRRNVAYVVGDRCWDKGLVGIRPSEPIPFERIPIQYERSFGGFHTEGRAAVLKASDRNPVGTGLVVSERDAIGERLPNFEDPRCLIQSAKDLPLPAGFGPIARHWMPRRKLAGTYDDSWVRSRAPIWPRDFDEQFFCTAPACMQLSPHLVGGETVSAIGVHPDGPIDFKLPARRFQSKFQLKGLKKRLRMCLDDVTIDSDNHCCTMTWRCALPVGRGLAGLESIIVRELEPWETPNEA